MIAIVKGRKKKNPKKKQNKKAKTKLKIEQQQQQQQKNKTKQKKLNSQNSTRNLLRRLVLFVYHKKCNIRVKERGWQKETHQTSDDLTVHSGM